MEKTRLGITISLLGGALYFVGLLGIIPLVILAGYVLIFEENAWLNKVAVKAVAVVIFFAVLSGAVGLIGDVSSFIVNFVNLFTTGFTLATLNRIVSLLQTAISFARVSLLILMGLSAMKMGDKSFGPVDRLISRHM